jgi:hypothetical protein
VVTPSTKDNCSRPLRGSLCRDAISEKTARSILRGLLQILGVSTNELLDGGKSPIGVELAHLHQSKHEFVPALR